MSTVTADDALQDWLASLNDITEIRRSDGGVLGYYTPANQWEGPDELEKEFLALAVLWKRGQGPGSSFHQMVTHPAYLRIISLGKPVVPLVFRELAREPDHWFLALSAVTGHDPVPPASRGDLKAMTDAWLQWGRQHGYLP
jgi:hypothetical protein